ncbi:MAG: peptidase M48 [Gammaproteobacteria bacterium]|nr:MAG: peptidase M48 [Gammaproteobacteria bacterium]
MLQVLRGFGFASLALLLLAAGPSVLAFGEVRLGERMHKELLEAGMIYDDEALSAYVEEVGQRLAAVSQDHRRMEYHFFVLDDAAVNALAFPGGYIYISRGLLAYLENESQLAAVLGHEVGHVSARHVARQRRAGRTSSILSVMAGILTGSGAIYQMGQAYGQMLISGYGREMELEADALGAEYLARAGYDPNAMLQVLQVLKDQELFAAQIEQRRPTYHGLYATHPRNDQRLHEVIRLGAANAGTGEYVEPVGDYLAMIDGLPWGDAAADGVVRGSRYYHGRLGIVIDFPEGWNVRDGATTLTAVPPGVSGAAMTVSLEALGQEGGSPEQFITGHLGLEVAAGEAIEVDGMPAYLAVLARQDNAARLQLAAVAFKEGRAYIFRGNNEDSSFDGPFIEGFSETVGSFRNMQAGDRSAATETRVALVQARPGDTFESMARRYRMGRDGADRLRLLNGRYPRGEPRAGDYVKVLR